uniref:Uncharacterized protein n=1 Tax=Arundo donax TaxID=35708 RepID=A0A0A9GG51_ARUDO
MEDLIVVGVIVFFSHLILTAGLRELGNIKHGEHNSGHITGGQVNKIIKTEDGDVFHCIDIRLQPALSHPLLRNHTIHIAGCRMSGEIYGTQVTINNYEPKVYGHDDYSAS